MFFLFQCSSYDSGLVVAVPDTLKFIKISNGWIESHNHVIYPKGDCGIISYESKIFVAFALSTEKNSTLPSLPYIRKLRMNYPFLYDWIYDFCVVFISCLVQFILIINEITWGDAKTKKILNFFRLLKSACAQQLRYHS